MLNSVLDRLRVAFPYIISVALPLAGIILAIVRYSQGERDDALRTAVAAVLGIFLYSLFVF